ncbi:MAG: Asp-tRNA(Asn)/Glu-tRNA(Gln) amidotransferase subunit GatA [Bacteroidia bacterium]|nr:Asp-tRNA(Asn)/Glu-tRNA(Gln) amidotransferase subunit GatA [Bacteroidia bacterium]
MNSYTTLKEIKADLLEDRITVEGLTKQYLARIEEKKHLHAFLEVFEATALEKARQVDQKLKNGTGGKLAGMVIGIKDNICYKGHQVSGASKILSGFESLFSSTVVERLLAEDAVIIGRLNCDEFAMGSSNENSAFGVVRNPLNEKLVPGGSSGGSAAAVAGNLCLAALGSDTGGSIRQPASFCGIVGLKPTYGRVSRWGLLAYGSSFDQIGPLTHTIEDTALILEVIAGKDDFDATASSKPVPAFSNQLKFEGKAKVCYLKECLESPALDSELKEMMFEKIAFLRSQGHEVEAVDFPYLDYLVPTYYVLTTAEASSNLSRYSGIHFGYRSPNATDLESTYKKSRSEGFGKEVQRRIMLGTFVLSAGYYDAYYTKAQKVRRVLRDFTSNLLKTYDFMIMPTTPGPAFEIGKKSNDPILLYLEDIYTVQANLVGVPAISIPLGNNKDGMPFGLQLMANHFEEEKLLQFANSI